MAQGHGMSVLTRAFVATKETMYLEAAERAARLFDVHANDGGMCTYSNPVTQTVLPYTA